MKSGGHTYQKLAAEPGGGGSPDPEEASTQLWRRLVLCVLVAVANVAATAFPFVRTPVKALTLEDSFDFGDSTLDLAGLALLQLVLVVVVVVWIGYGGLPTWLVPDGSSIGMERFGSWSTARGLSMGAPGSGRGSGASASRLLGADRLKDDAAAARLEQGSPEAETDTWRMSRLSSMSQAELPSRRELLEPFDAPQGRTAMAIRAASLVMLLVVVSKCIARMIELAGAASGYLRFWLAVSACVVCPVTLAALLIASVKLSVEVLLVERGWVPPRAASEFVRPASKDRASMRDLLQLLLPDLHLVCLALVGLSVAAAGEALIPFLYGKIIEEVALKNDQTKFHLYMLALVVTAAITGLFTGVRGSTFIVLGARFSVRLRHLLFSSLLNQEVGFFDSTKTGDISSRLSADCQKVGEQVELNVNVALRSLLQAALTLGFMFFINWKLACVAFVTVPNVVVASKLFGAFMRRLSKDVQQSLADSTARAEEALGTIRTVKAHHAEAELCSEYQVELLVYRKLSEKLAAVYFPFSALTYTFLPYCASCLVLFYGGKLVNHDGLSSGELVSFVFYMQSLFNAFNSIGAVYVSLVQAVGAADKVFEWIHRQPTLRPATDASGLVPSKLTGAVQLNQVVFRYPTRPERVVLNGLSLCAEPGKVLALVGASGGGKSSVLALVQYWYDCEGGEVMLDGVPVRELNREWFHRTVALVSQEPVLYNRTIFENIVLGLLTNDESGDDGRRPSREEVLEACHMANAHDFISALPDGYDTNVGERGTKLSGGQRQRLAIARALVRKPKVLLLDEATSALDSESEFQVQEAIDRMISQGDMTVMIIAHRLSTIKNADLIVVINEGMVVEQGTHSELMGQQGAYKTLVTRQLNQPIGASLPHDLQVAVRAADRRAAAAPVAGAQPMGAGGGGGGGGEGRGEQKQRRPSVSPQKDYSYLTEGAKIEAKWRKTKWYRAVVTAVHEHNNSVDVKYADGGREKGISRVLTRRLPS